MKRNHLEPAQHQGEEQNVNQIVSAVLKAVMVTLISTIASICVDKIRRYNEEKREDYYQPYDDDHENW